jgi:membrane protein YqaA with SNARE-associated domain
LALPALFLGSVLESSFLPWPIELPMLAYMLRGRWQAAIVTVIVTLGSVTGCVLIYALGRASYGLVADFVSARPSLEAALALAKARIDEEGALAVGFAMLAPTPVQVASLAAGLAHMNPFIFVVAAFIGRSLRYWAMGGLVMIFGPAILDMWRRLPRRLQLTMIVALALVFAALLALSIAGMMRA